ncbi:MAG: BdrF [Candidatus Magnetoglobus multicellularis str. Araruama]|uniref:BdrF n=1 Tax=Candidatus Magnetoglobus multicellularis str. Araruama TaxID=890399 RepID=A0A1V1P2T6_9BACT|nr:MAG: BdrF [Candidatus Magnetoglobus multicellularis str. Araruama]
MVPKAEPAVSHPVDDIDESQKLSTIRNILLGGQIQQYDSRFSEIEKQFEIIKNSLFDQTKETLSGLEKQVTSEFENITTRITEQVKTEFEIYTEKLDTEKKERYSSIEKFVSRLDQLDTEFQKQFNDIKTQIQGIETTLQQKISSQVEIIKQDLQAEFDTLSASIQDRVKQHTQNKIERTEMVGFFKDMADRFSL